MYNFNIRLLKQFRTLIKVYVRKIKDVPIKLEFHHLKVTNSKVRTNLIICAKRLFEWLEIPLIQVMCVSRPRLKSTTVTIVRI